MIDARFSAEAFARLGARTPEAEQLSYLLQSEIAAEVHAAFDKAVRKIVAQLRELGHDLQEMERSSSPIFHQREYTFGPPHPSSPEGWLAVHIDTSATVMYLNVEAVAAQESGEPPSDEAVPF